MANQFAEMDRWTRDEVTLFKKEGKNRERARGFDHRVIVAEGDSWFDYLPGTDIIDCLRNHYDYTIDNNAKAGDTLENMIYGTPPEASPEQCVQLGKTGVEHLLGIFINFGRHFISFGMFMERLEPGVDPDAAPLDAVIVMTASVSHAPHLDDLERAAHEPKGGSLLLQPDEPVHDVFILLILRTRRLCDREDCRALLREESLELDHLLPAPKKSIRKNLQLRDGVKDKALGGRSLDQGSDFIYRFPKLHMRRVKDGLLAGKPIGIHEGLHLYSFQAPPVGVSHPFDIAPRLKKGYMRRSISTLGQDRIPGGLRVAF